MIPEEEFRERRYSNYDDIFADREMDFIERRMHARDDPCRGCEEDMGY